MTITLPEPPSSNRYWRTRVLRTRLGKSYAQVYRSPEATAYLAAAHNAALAQGMRPVSGPVRLTLRWFRSRKAGDLSNRVKVVEDSLQGVAYHNDKQVVELHATRHDDPQRPRLEVEVVALEAQRLV